MSRKLFNLIQKETERQRSTLSLIASENVVPKEILDILATPLVNKYSEGYPGRRYYPGNEFVDEIELLAQAEGLKAFGLKGKLSTELPTDSLNLRNDSKNWFVNVQPASGSAANLAIYFALA